MSILVETTESLPSYKNINTTKRHGTSPTPGMRNWKKLGQSTLLLSTYRILGREVIPTWRPVACISTAANNFGYNNPWRHKMEQHNH
jgi:hypothetical protein